MKEKFKEFVRKKPELIKYVNSGKNTWQGIYEIWSLYGEDDKIWKEYAITENNTKEEKKEEVFSFSSLMDSVKKLDMDSVKKGIGNVQKAIELLQGLTTKNTVNQSGIYKPRQLFKKFED